MAIIQTPQGTVNYAVFINGDRHDVGIATVDLPEIAFKTATVSGAGIAGEFEAPFLGQTESLEVTLNFSSVSSDLTKFIQPGSFLLTLRAASQEYDNGTGRTVVVPTRIEARAQSTGLGMGTLGPAVGTESTVTLSILALQLFRGPEKILDIDKPNGKFEANGVDFMRGVNRALGR